MVIAVIYLLSAILFPVFGLVRENARRSSCQSNLKQIGLAMAQYTQDFDENVVFDRSQFHGTVRSGIAFPGWVWCDWIFPYVKNERIFNCPSESFKAPDLARPYLLGQWRTKERAAADCCRFLETVGGSR